MVDRWLGVRGGLFLSREEKRKLRRQKFCDDDARFSQVSPACSLCKRDTRAAGCTTHMLGGGCLYTQYQTWEAASCSTYGLMRPGSRTVSRERWKRPWLGYPLLFTHCTRVHYRVYAVCPSMPPALHEMRLRFTAEWRVVSGWLFPPRRASKV